MIYIIGGNGFVGSGFVRLFERLGLPHQIIDRKNQEYFSKEPCSVLINANGNSSKLLAKQDPVLDFDANVRSTKIFLEEFIYDFYIHLSSCDVYADCSAGADTSEETQVDIATLSPYGFHKRMAEDCVRFKCPNWLILRQGGFVGPGMKKNAIFDIIQGGPLWLAPGSKLQFMHTDDSAAIIWKLYTDGLHNEVFNVCGQGCVTLRDVAQWAGSAPAVKPGSPCVHYEVGIEKIQKYAAIPQTADIVRNFVTMQHGTASV